MLEKVFCFWMYEPELFDKECLGPTDMVRCSQYECSDLPSCM